MRYDHILVLITVILSVLAGLSAGSVTDEHTVDEWRAILAVGDQQQSLAGLQMSLSLEPDKYYLPVGTQVNLSGQLMNVFGPLRHVPVVFATGYDTKPDESITLTTDENGEFGTSDIVNRTGIIRYQAWFNGTDLKDTNRTSSPEIEVKGIAPSHPVAAEEELPARKDSEGNQPEGAKITLQADTDSYVSGQKVTFSGLLTGAENEPLPHSGVDLEMSYGKSLFEKTGDTLLTGKNGNYSASFHLTGPDSPTWRAVSTDRNGNTLTSNEVSLTFNPDSFDPPARIRPSSRQIDADLAVPIIQTGQNFTISGWFADGKGDAIAPGRLNLYWFNFADRIWDRYEPGSDMITGQDGYYAINVSGPDLTGVTYVAIVSKYEENRKPLFSPALVLTVRNESETNRSEGQVFLDGSVIPDEVQTFSPAMVTFRLSDAAGNPLISEPVRVFFSEDGFTWYMNGNENLTTSSEGTITFNDTPKKPGFHYYRGVYNGTETYRAADSGIIVLAITGNSTRESMT